MYIKKILSNEVKRCKNCGKDVLFYHSTCPYCNTENASEDERNRIFDEAATWSFRLLIAKPVVLVVLAICVILTFCFDFNRSVKSPLSELPDIKQTSMAEELCYVDVELAELWFCTYPEGFGGDMGWLDEVPAGEHMSNEEKAFMRNTAQDAITYYYLATASDKKQYVISVEGSSYEKFESKLDEKDGALRIYGIREPELESSEYTTDRSRIGVSNAEDVLADIHARSELIVDVNQYKIIKADLELQEKGYFTKEEHWVGFWLMWVDILLLAVAVIVSKVRQKIDAVAMRS